MNPSVDKTEHETLEMLFRNKDLSLPKQHFTVLPRRWQTQRRFQPSGDSLSGDPEKATLRPAKGGKEAPNLWAWRTKEEVQQKATYRGGLQFPENSVQPNRQ